MNLSFVPRCTQRLQLSLFVRRPKIPTRSRHSLCAVAADGYPSIAPVISQEPILDVGAPAKFIIKGPRLPFEPIHEARPYGPFFREFLRGLWKIDWDRDLFLLDSIVGGTSCRRLKAEESAAFAAFEPVINAPTFVDAMNALNMARIKYEASNGVDYSSPKPEDDLDSSEELEEVAEAPRFQVPVWVSGYLLSTMIKRSSDALQCFGFTVSILDATVPRHRGTLLVLCMSSLARFKILFQIPYLLDTFNDCILREDDIKTQHRTIYCYNVILTLISRLGNSENIANAVSRFLASMESSNVFLETDTAKKICDARFTRKRLVMQIEKILQRQEDPAQGREDEVAAILAKYYTKRRDSTKAAEFVEQSKAVDTFGHLKAYLRSFQDTTSALGYMRGFSLERGGSGNQATQEEQPAADLQDGPVLDVTERQIRLGKLHIYTSLLHSAAKSTAISTETFQSFFVKIRRSYGADKAFLTVALDGLFRRRAWNPAKLIWNDWESQFNEARENGLELRRLLNKPTLEGEDEEQIRKEVSWTKNDEMQTVKQIDALRIDSTALAYGVRAIAGPKPSALLDAFKLMDRYALKREDMTIVKPDGSFEFPRKDYDDPYRSERIRLTPRVLNNFMVRAIAFRRPDVVFRLWDEMSLYYVTEPSLGTLTVLMIAARMAASMDSSLMLFMPHWLRGGSFFRQTQFTSFTEEMEHMLSGDHRPRLLWHNEYPWRIVRHIIREKILFNSWPHLRYVEVPAHPTYEDDATSRMEAYRELKARESISHFAVQRPHKYPQLIPTQDTFRKYILLLGRVDRSSEIPEVLAWMKALDIVPSKGTLAIALAHWSKVAADTPVDEAWNERNMARVVENNGALSSQAVAGEYNKLIAWLKDWLNVDGIPSEPEVLATFTYIQRLEERERHLY